MTMRLKLLLPTRVLIDTAIQRLVAEAENGSFGMLARHIDFATALKPGILVYQDVENAEHFVGVDEGILVKCRGEVLVSTRNAVIGTDLASLRQTVRERYLELDEGEKLARSALARLEVGVVKRFNELRELR
jgi:F-type H+-transporting ATPase subunit epsilon